MPAEQIGYHNLALADDSDLDPQSRDADRPISRQPSRTAENPQTSPRPGTSGVTQSLESPQTSNERSEPQTPSRAPPIGVLRMCRNWNQRNNGARERPEDQSSSDVFIPLEPVSSTRNSGSPRRSVNLYSRQVSSAGTPLGPPPGNPPPENTPSENPPPPYEDPPRYKP